MESEAKAVGPREGARRYCLPDVRMRAKGETKIASERGVQPLAGVVFLRKPAGRVGRQRTPGGRGTNRLSKIESILGTGMSQNLSRDRRLTWRSGAIAECVSSARGDPMIGKSVLKVDVTNAQKSDSCTAVSLAAHALICASTESNRKSSRCSFANVVVSDHI